MIYCLKYLTYIIFIFPFCEIWAQYNIDFLSEKENEKIDDLLYDCSRDNKWNKLYANPDIFPDTGYNQTIRLANIIDSNLLRILDNYVTADSFNNNNYYYLNMCQYEYSYNKEMNNFDIIVVRYIPSPSSIDECVGLLIYKSVCFFIQSDFEEFIELTDIVKIFHMNKYPIIYIDAEFPIDYYLYKDGEFYEFIKQ